ncbi:MAG TPA: cysteine desulfurase [Lactobacillaceae bacterium]|jgi:hypothetical protein
MAFETTVTVAGDATYRLHPNLKKYTLGDTGFVQNPAGAYILHRALEPEKALANSIQLKISVNKTLDGFKLSTVSAGDVARVDIFKRGDQAIIDMYRYFLADLIEREVLQIV